MKSEKKLRKIARKAQKRQRVLLEDIKEIVARAENGFAICAERLEKYKKNPNAWKCKFKCAN